MQNPAEITTFVGGGSPLCLSGSGCCRAAYCQFVPHPANGLSTFVHEKGRTSQGLQWFIKSSANWLRGSWLEKPFFCWNRLRMVISTTCQLSCQRWLLLIRRLDNVYRLPVQEDYLQRVEITQGNGELGPAKSQAALCRRGHRQNGYKLILPQPQVPFCLHTIIGGVKRRAKLLLVGDFSQFTSVESLRLPNSWSARKSPSVGLAWR